MNPSTAVALLITDANHGIPVEINRTGLQTIALGRGDAQSLSLPFLSSNADVKVGDLIVSSGLGGRFPAGYPVGEIYEIRNSPGEHFAEALAYPTAKLNQGRQALLIWGEHPEGTPASPLPDHIYLAVDELEPVRAAIPANGGRLAPGDVHGDPAGQVARRPWGEVSFYAFDPSGNPLCFVQRGSEFLGRPHN